MASTQITQLADYPTGSPLVAKHLDDVLVIVDTNDIGMASTGTDKKIRLSQLTYVFDLVFGTIQQGDILYRDVAAWSLLHPTTSGYVLATQSTGANPHWISAADALNVIGSTQGDILYRGVSSWGALAPGSANYILTSGGPSANPSWAANTVGAVTGAAPLASPTFTGTVTISTASNLVLTDQASAPFVITTGTTYGTVIGGTTSQKVGFYNTTPIVQPSGDIVAGLTNLGLIASPQITHWTGGITSISGTTSVAINCANTNAFHVALQTTGAHTFTVSNLTIGQTIKITTIQGGSPSNSTISWAGQTIRWAGGTAGQATATANQGDMFVLYGVSGASPPAADVIAGGVSLANF